MKELEEIREQSRRESEIQVEAYENWLKKGFGPSEVADEQLTKQEPEVVFPKGDSIQTGSAGSSLARKGSVFHTHYHRQRKLQEHSENVSLECCKKITQAFKEQVWPKDLTKATSWGGDEDVDKHTQNWVNAVIQMEDPIWDEFENIPDLAALTVQKHISDSLTQHHGWSLDSIDRRLRSDFPQLEPWQRRRIARTEVSAILNMAQIDALLALKEEPLVRWVGPGDQDSTDLCRDLEEETKDGVPLEKFLELLEEYAKTYPEGKVDRLDQALPHIQCRYTIEIVE